MGKKSVKTLKIYKTRKIKQNKKRFADLASISHGIFFKVRKKNNSKNSRQMARMALANDLARNMQMSQAMINTDVLDPDSVLRCIATK